MEMESQNCTHFLVLLFIYFVLCFGFSFYCLWAAWSTKVSKTRYIRVILSLLLCHFIYTNTELHGIFYVALSLSHGVGRIEFMVLVFCSLLLWLTKGTAHNSLKDCCTKFFDTIIHWFQLSLLSWHVCVCVHVRCTCVWHLGILMERQILRTRNSLCSWILPPNFSQCRRLLRRWQTVSDATSHQIVWVCHANFAAAHTKFLRMGGRCDGAGSGDVVGMGWMVFLINISRWYRNVEWWNDFKWNSQFHFDFAAHQTCCCLVKQNAILGVFKLFDCVHEKLATLWLSFMCLFRIQCFSICSCNASSVVFN